MESENLVLLCGSFQFHFTEAVNPAGDSFQNKLLGSIKKYFALSEVKKYKLVVKVYLLNRKL